jgi:hypothetical protein
MKKLFFLSLVFVSVSIAHAQKKLTLVTQSTITGIGLPNGSKQDSRILSVAAAATLLEMESEKANTKVQDTEVLMLPPTSQIKFNKDSLGNRLKANNWKITVSEDDEYLWLQKDKRFVIAYFSMGSNGTSLYFAEATSPPNFKEQADNTPTNQPIVQPVVTPVVQPGNQPVLQSSTTTINSPILGTWRRGKGVTGYGGRWSSTGYQYTFNANGTYSYLIKTYAEDDPETLLTRESGNFSVSGNTVTLDPKTNVIEAWSKSNGGDNYKALITSQNKSLEKITYQFTIHFFPELKETDLVLIYGKETVRDGKYNASDAFPTGWRFSPAGPEYKPIPLPGEQSTTTQEIKKDPAQQSGPVANGKFTFTTINFDDGWVSAEREDWVEVTKSNVKVLIHYPNATTSKYISDSNEELQIAWNTLVAPRYSNLQNYFVARNSVSYFQSSFVSGTLTDKQTGQPVYVALFKRDHGAWLEFIAPNINTFGQVIGFDISKLNDYVSSSDWDPLLKLEYYNRFAVAASDLTGTWTNNFGGYTQYVNAYTGADAGMNTHSSTQTFEFLTDGTYNWSISVASGFVGNIKFSGAKSSGKFTNPNNWQIHFSELEGKPRLYNAYFSCVKGARILWLQDTGYGDYSSYGRRE